MRIIAYYSFLIASPAVVFILQAILGRVMRRRYIPPQIFTVLCMALSFAVYLACAILVLPYLAGASGHQKASFLLFTVIVCGSLMYTYFHLFNMSETARRIRIMREIYFKGALREEEVRGFYDMRAIVDARIARLVETGQVSGLGGRYRMQSMFLHYIACALFAYRRFLRL